MNDLERRAVLGDRKAQEECTRLGIALPCPYCGNPMTKMAGWIYHPNVMCIVGTKAFRASDTRTLDLWNRRPAPPDNVCVCYE